MIKISCIIYIFNEEKNIWNILKFFSEMIWNEIYEIIVVNDYSSEKTKEIVEDFFQIKILENKESIWKDLSFLKWIENSSWNYIFLVDPDLKNIKKEDIYEVISPIYREKCDIVIKNNNKIIKKEFLTKKLQYEKDLKLYWLDFFINKIIKENILQTKIIK